MNIKLEQLTERQDFNSKGTYQTFLFRIYDVEKYVGEIAVSKLVETKLDSLLSDEFFFEDGKSLPYVVHLIVRPEYRGRRIAGKLAEFANYYFKQHDNITLHSGVLNSANAIKVCERLVKEGKAEEMSYKGKKRWKLF